MRVVALDVGDLYFDTASQTMKVYSSSGWIPAGSSVNGTSSRFTYTVSSSTTTITGADDNTNTLAYDAGFVDVYLNGVKQILGTDVTATSGTSLVFASALANGDVVDVVGFGTFQLANISIKDLTDTPSSFGTAGQALVMNSSANGLVFSNASSAEVYGFKKSFTASTLNRTVTVVSVGGSNKYFIDGVQQDTLELLEGNTYIFAYPSGHPFKLAKPATVGHSSLGSAIPSPSVSAQPLNSAVPATSGQSSLASVIPSPSVSGQPLNSAKPGTSIHSSSLS